MPYLIKHRTDQNFFKWNIWGEQDGRVRGNGTHPPQKHIKNKYTCRQFLQRID